MPTLEDTTDIDGTTNHPNIILVDTQRIGNRNGNI